MKFLGHQREFKLQGTLQLLAGEIWVVHDQEPFNPCMLRAYHPISRREAQLSGAHVPACRNSATRIWVLFGSNRESKLRATVYCFN